MEYRLATNWKNVIYFDESGQVVYEWDGDIVRIERIKFSKKKIKIRVRIKSVFAKDTKKVEVLYNDENYPLELKIKENVAIAEGEIPVRVQKNDEIRFQVTCFKATQRSRITFVKEDIVQKAKEDGTVAVSKDWCVILEQKRMIFMPNGGWKGKLKGSLYGFRLNH